MHFRRRFQVIKFRATRLWQFSWIRCQYFHRNMSKKISLKVFLTIFSFSGFSCDDCCAEPSQWYDGHRTVTGLWGESLLTLTFSFLFYFFLSSFFLFNTFLSFFPHLVRTLVPVATKKKKRKNNDFFLFFFFFCFFLLCMESPTLSACGCQLPQRKREIKVSGGDVYPLTPCPMSTPPIQLEFLLFSTKKYVFVFFILETSSFFSSLNFFSSMVKNYEHKFVLKSNIETSFLSSPLWIFHFSEAFVISFP